MGGQNDHEYQGHPSDSKESAPQDGKTQGDPPSDAGTESTSASTSDGAATSSKSGYMVASGEGNGKLACKVGDDVYEGDYQGSEGDPCTVNDET